MKLEERMKKYETTSCYKATIKTPLMIRVDGRAFHSFTHNMNKPFDARIISAMVASAKAVAMEMQGFKAAYVQSDEASFCITDYDELNSEGWFGFNLAKIISVSASLMSVHFSKHFGVGSYPTFDCRAFSLPVVDVVNAFLWRAQDWKRNSLQMYCRAFFSHEQLHNKSSTEMHEMLHSVGKNWTTDLSLQERNGTFLISEPGGIRVRTSIEPKYESINAATKGMFDYPEGGKEKCQS